MLILVRGGDLLMICSWYVIKLNILTAVSSQDEDMGHFEIPDPMEESTTSLVSSSTSAYSSFPVDVVVYVRVQVMCVISS